MAPSRIQRNIRPVSKRHTEDDDLELEDVVEGVEDHSSGGEEDDVEEDGQSASDNDAESLQENESEHEEPEDSDVEQQISNVSFGALKQAQGVISKKRKRGSDTSPAQEDKLENLRARLQEIKKQKAATSSTEGSKRKPTPKKDELSNDEDSEEDDDSDSAPSEEGAPKTRAKHAPAAQSSRHQVTRKRQVIEVPKSVARDPRFDALHRPPIHPGNSEKAYAFLRDYQKDEIADLKAAMKVTKNDEDWEKLKRMSSSMENRLKAKEAKERQQEVLRRHRKEEKGKIEQGKNPYYLKKSELKEQTLVEKFKNMKGKERERLMDRRRLKESQKEKKRMPEARRGVP